MPRLLLAHVAHETNTFSRLPTDLPAFGRRYHHLGDAVATAMRGTRSEMGGFLDAADKYGWEVVHPISAAATPSGLVTADAWAALTGPVIAACDGRIDGVLLALHGAMVAEGADDAEGDLLTRIRAKLGPDVPIAITLDLHANVTETMCRHANIVIAYRTYPHVDQYETAQHAALLMARTLAGEIRPRAVVTRRPTLVGFDGGKTTVEGVMTEALRRADAFEKEKGILVVSVHAGFTRSDIHDAGPSVAVTHDGSAARARAIAEELMDYCWERRTQTSSRPCTVGEAVSIARRPDTSGKPLVLADFTDNPGGGGYGDATNLVRGLLAAGIAGVAVCPITDVEAVAACRKAGVGATVTLAIGGKIDPEFGGPPITVEGTVGHLGTGAFTFDGPMWKGVKSSMGDTAVLRVGGMEIVLAANRFQTIDRQHFLSVGIDPTERNVLVVKSSQHFRATFQPMARRVLTVDTGALTTPDYSRFTYRKLRRPIWPLDPVA
ncbi:MAG: M81 family metallopeptidase [Alphaproteobacteria bacterium]|nr:M81 family metallopeptidase [Alphaproteobacteria bacterium]